MLNIDLRDLSADDFDVLFKHQRDPLANHMAAFTAKDPNDRVAFEAHMGKILANETVVKHVVVLEEEVVGNIMSFMNGEHREVCYWIDRAHWGRGIATKALGLMLQQVTERPIYAGVAKDNAASIRVLEKCGFVVCDEGRGFANGRGEEIEEYVMRLDG